ncbi:kinase-like domain-containing protein [Sparassis latifolia]
MTSPWEALRPIFKTAGYELYRARGLGKLSTPDTETSPAVESFGLFGDRSNFQSQLIPFAQVFAARDSLNRDVVIKVVSKGKEGENERQILQLLNSEPLRSHPANTTVPVLEFIDYEDFCFAVMPFCNGSDDFPFLNASECLDFAEQVLKALSFLHEHRIAHLDISSENVMVNHHGTLPEAVIFEDGKIYRICPVPEWRSTFSVRYRLMDFGYSVHFKEDTPLSMCTILPFPQGREHRAPETLGKTAYNPFAADVYQTARVFYGLFSDVANSVPDLLKLLQDMSSYNPSRRITATMALARLRALCSTIPVDMLQEEQEREILSFPDIPRSNLITFRDIIETGNCALACQFAWGLLKAWVRNIVGAKRERV